MIARPWTNRVRNALKKFPAVVLLGPRQVGKTTLAREMSSEYFDLESDEEWFRLQFQWDDLLKGKALVVLDEAQSRPEVFSKIRSAIDAQRKRNGRFLLLGSVSPALMVNISQSLAGRLARVHLTPFLLTELKSEDRNRHWRVGGYPDGGILAGDAFPEWQREYIEVLCQRDLPEWGLPATPSTTIRLIRMLAAVHGQTLNASQLGKSMGLSHHTIKKYIEYLEGAFLVRVLEPYYANLKKRLVKSPKIYIRDSGLLHALLNVGVGEELSTKPWVGASWEGYVIEQTLGQLELYNISFDPYFLRTNTRDEIDLLLDFGQEKWAIEVKHAASPTTEDLEKLTETAKLVGATKCILVSRTEKHLEASDGKISTNPEGLLTYMKKAFG